FLQPHLSVALEIRYSIQIHVQQRCKASAEAVAVEAGARLIDWNHLVVEVVQIPRDAPTNRRIAHQMLERSPIYSAASPYGWLVQPAAEFLAPHDERWLIPRESHRPEMQRRIAVEATRLGAGDVVLAQNQIKVAAIS